MKRIAILTFGTYCDQKITYILAKKFLSNGFKVNYITNTPTSFFQENKDKNLKIITYETTNYININDPSIINTKIDWNLLFNIKILNFAYYIKTILNSIINKAVSNCDFILIHYPALVIASVLPSNLPIPIGIFFVAPAYPNKDIPYIMSDEINEKSFLKSSNIKEYNSSKFFLNAMSLINISTNYFQNLLEKSYIFAMWEKTSLSLPRSDLKVTQIGSIIDNENIVYTPTVKVKEFISKTNKVYISMGSLNLGNNILPIIKSLIKNGYIVLFHGKSTEELEKIQNNLYIYSSFIPHEWIIPKIDLVVTSGSLCMTAIANKYGKPLIYFPTSNEQLFWAKNYYRNTGTKYIKKEGTISQIYRKTNMILKSMENNRKLISFSKKLKNEISKKDSSAILVEKIKEII